MNRILICTLATAAQLTLFQLTSFAQSTAQLPGKWYANSIIRKSTSDTISQKLMELVLGKNSFKQFLPNHRFVSFDNQHYSYGTWELSDNKLKMFCDSGGSVFAYDVNRVSANELLLSINDKFIYFIKATDSLVADKKPASNKTTRVKANKDQLAKKWYFSKLIEAPGDAKTSSFVAKMLKNSWYNLKADGSCTRMFTKPLEGSWELTDDGKRLLVIDDTNMGQAWDIIHLTANELILQIPNSKTQRVFSTIQKP
jgi:hypothetical protein